MLWYQKWEREKGVFINHLCSDNKYKSLYSFSNMATFYISKGENFFKMVTFVFSYKKEKILLVETIFGKTLIFHKLSKNENLWFKTSWLADNVKLMTLYNLC